MKEKYLTRIFLRNVVINWITQALVFISAIVSVPYLISNLGLGQYGLLVITTTLIGYASIFISPITEAMIKYGAQFTAKRQKKLFSDYLSTTFFISIFIAIATVVIFFYAGSIFMNLAVSADNLLPIFNNIRPWMLIYLFFLIIGNSLWTTPVALQKFELANIKEVYLGIVLPLGSLTITIFGGQLVEIFYFYAIISFMFAITFILINFFLTNSFIYPSLSYSAFSALIKFSISKLISQINGQITFHSDKMLLGYFFPISLLPYYSVPLSLVQRALFFSMNIVPTAFPYFSHFAARFGKDKLSQQFMLITKGVNIIIIFLFLYIFFFAEELLSLWLGNEFATQSAVFLRFLSLAYLIYSFAAIPSVMLEATGKVQIPAFFSTISSLTQIILFFILIPRYQAQGAVMALLLNASFQVPIFLFYTLTKVLPNKFLKLVKNMFIPLSVAFTVFFFLSQLPIFGQTRWELFLSLSSFFLIGLCLYLIILRVRP